MFKKSLLVAFILLISATYSVACVGKTIYVGHGDSKQEEIMGNIFSRLILERTGTTAKLKKYGSPKALLDAAQNGEVDIFVLSDEQIKTFGNGGSHDELKTQFNVKFNLVWLKPILSEKNEFLVPVIRKDTLKKFPALPKLIEKLEGKINKSVLENLAALQKNKSLKDIVKDFLKENKLI